MIFRLRAAAALTAALLVAAPALAGPDYSAARKAQYPSPNLLAPDTDRLTIRGAGIACAPGATCDVSGLKAAPSNGSTMRPFADWLGDVPNIRSFGSPTNGDWTAVFQAAEASSAKRIFLPAGSYPVRTGHYELIGKTYEGPGQIVVGADANGNGGVASAPFRSFITNQLPDVPDDRLAAFSTNTWSKALPGGVGYTFIGSGATGTPGSVYKNFPQLSQTFRVFDNTAGYNTDPADHAKGRSGIFADTLRVYHGGQGDLVGSTFYGVVYSQRQGATHWLASPAIVARNGNLGADVSGTGGYVNESEFIYTDSGASIAVVDRVRNYNRTNGNVSLYQVWVHDRPQSSGPVPIDGFYLPTGKARRGYDTTAADFGSEGAAIVLSPGQKVYFAASVTPDPVMGTKFGATDLGGASAFFDGATNTLRINPGTGRSVVIENLPTSAAGLVSGALYKDANGFIKAAP